MLQPRLNAPTWRCVVAQRKPHPGNIINAFELRFGSTTAASRDSSNILHNGTAKQPRRTSFEFPLSVMPTKMLLRSLFIATISSNKFLLIPSLHLLSFFAKPNRSFLFNVDRNPILKAILKRSLYNQFCAGETEKETRSCVQQLKNLGFKGVILTYAKETVDTKSESSSILNSDSRKLSNVGDAVTKDTDIEAWRVGTLNTASLISEGDILAIK